MFEAEDYSSFTPEKLYELIKDRKINPNEKSYTTYLFEKGLDKILKKVGEECTEVIIGAKIMIMMNWDMKLQIYIITLWF